MATNQLSFILNKVVLEEVNLIGAIVMDNKGSVIAESFNSPFDSKDNSILLAAYTEISDRICKEMKFGDFSMSIVIASEGNIALYKGRMYSLALISRPEYKIGMLLITLNKLLDQIRDFL